MNESKRTAEEYIILALSGATAMAILPFAIFRMFNTDWAIAALDVSAVILAAGLFGYVFKTHHTRVPGQLLAVICLVVLGMTVWLKGVQQIFWTYPVITALFFLLTPKTAAIICFMMLGGLGIMVADQFSAFSATQFYISAIATLSFTFVFADRMRQQHRQLVNLATRDALTGAFNRRAMEEKLHSITARSRRNPGMCASLILMDLDEFKKVNDDFGHAAGDDILIKFVEVVHKRIRETDYLYRFGGEEFVILTENTTLQDAVSLAEELRECVESHPDMASYGITISVGTARYQNNETPFEWLGRADKAMYQAKDQGRNACCVA